MEKIDIHYEDGHPSFSNNGKFLITDTYPNENYKRKLIHYDWDRKKKVILGEFYSLPGLEFLEFTQTEEGYKNWGDSEFRVDLHPRLNFQGDKVTFDSIHEGKRNCYFDSIHEGKRNCYLLLLNN